ncbi:MAG TPA: sulfotransferase [Solirubrobacteraceae bacterium]|nr:sulfotransferase [Solirubrobacteraceae bacterium]
MTWRRTVNAALSRATGFELRRAGAVPRGRPPRRGDRLLEAPAFILCTVRSGSTLLRVLLDSHSQIHSPPELHLRDLAVALKSRYAERSLMEIGLDVPRLEHLLWDRVLHRELQASGKRLLVNKTPNDVFIADRIRTCWPDARFIFLLRHPAEIARSRQDVRPQDTAEQNAAMVLRYGEALEQARSTYDGLTVRYEEVATDTEAVARRLCTFLRVGWEPRMLDYGRFDHGRFRPGLGDWKDKIKSGRVQPPAPLPAPEDVPPALRALSEAWGYLPAGGGAPPPRPSAELPHAS